MTQVRDRGILAAIKLEGASQNDAERPLRRAQPTPIASMWGSPAFLILIAVGFGGLAMTPAAAAQKCPKPLTSDATTTRIYVSTKGNDKNNGVPGKPVKSLAAAYRIAAASRLGKVEVLIEPGTYFGQVVEWTEPIDRHTRFSTFPGKACSAGNNTRAVFDGRRSANDSYGTANYFLRFDSAPKTTSSMIFENITVKYYKNGVHLGSHSNESLVRNNVFANIGDRFIRFKDSRDPSTSVIGIFSSHNNQIVGNTFTKIEGPAQLHAVYIIRSTGNEIRKNMFTAFSPNLSAIKVRNYSIDTVVKDNTFNGAGANAVIDSFCSEAKKEDECKNEDECPSWNTLVEDNIVRGMKKVTAVLVESNNRCNPDNPKPQGARRFIERNGTPNKDAYCHAKYRSYKSKTGTYTGYDGRQHSCR